MNETDNLKRLNEFCRNSLVEHLGIEYTAMGEGWIEAWDADRPPDLPPGRAFARGSQYGIGGNNRRGYQCNYFAWRTRHLKRSASR